jgi:ribonuclease HII
MRYVIGVDESGCGALVGPLVVCAAAFAEGAERVSAAWHGVREDKILLAGDSKGFKHAEHRAALAEAVRAASPSLITIERSSADIDQHLLGGVFSEALQLAALRCLERLKTLDPSVTSGDITVMVDGDVPQPNLPCVVRCIPNGDKTDWRIGAASIVARAICDQRIDAIHAEYPRWGFDRSRGYPTPEHKALLLERGPLPIHRRTFKPVRDVLPTPIGVEE